MTNNLDQIIEEIINEPSDFNFKSNQTLFETLGVLNKEIRHSNMICWLLNIFRDEKTQKYILLDFLMKELEYAKFIKKNSTPKRINTEESTGVENRDVDIYIEWDDFILLIENKIHSSEQKKQCSDYLRYFKDHKDNTKKKVKLIYLTKTGKRPPSIPPASELDQDLECLSYQELIVHLKKFSDFINEKKEIKKHKIILKDYIISCQKLLGLGVTVMAKDLKISKHSELLFEHHDKLYETTKDKGRTQLTFFEQALADTRDLIDYIQTELTEKFKEEFKLTRRTSLNLGEGHFFWSKDDWIKIKEDKTFYFGFKYQAAAKSGKRLFPYMDHPVGLYVPSKDEHKNFKDIEIGRRNNLVVKVRSILNNVNDELKYNYDEYCVTNNNEKHWIVFTNWEENKQSNSSKYNAKKWADRLVKKSCQMANRLIPIIDKNLDDIWEI